jgi:hypothetical protein
MPGEFYVEGKKQQLDLTEIKNISNQLQNILTEVQNIVTQVDNVLTDVQNSVTQVQNNVTQIQSDVITIKTTTGEQLSGADFWSDPLQSIEVEETSETEGLPAVTIDGLPVGAAVLRAVAMFKFRMVRNEGADFNHLDGGTVPETSQVIQVRDDTPGLWGDAINFEADQFFLAAEAREGGDVFIGSIDISSIVDGNDVYEFQWLLAKAVLDTMVFNDIQMGIRVWYSVSLP